ncbi:MAG: ATP-binding cassette domain-containing protein [Oscillospiraceae bacterium]|nr:ATP-binding cassette domain-containing protein [Oscillospiraceae bacterium]
MKLIDYIRKNRRKTIMQIIKVDNLKKHYDYYQKDLGLKNSLKNIIGRKKLKKEAVNEISFSIEAGEIVGFIGPNGAGKTTTLKMLSGILFPTSGTASVGGFTPWERKKAFKMGFSIVMGQKTQLNWDLPAIETFNLNKCIYEVEDAVFKKTVGELIELLGVESLMKTQVRRLSLGERMKMELIAALVHRPKIIFLDEPTIGLDFASQKTIREFVRHYNEETGATILLTSHYMNDIESLCKRAIVINEGHLIYDGSLAGIANGSSLPMEDAIQKLYDKPRESDSE